MSNIKNNLPSINNKVTSFIYSNTLQNICNSLRIRTNSNQNFKISSIPNFIRNTNFGVSFPGGYGGLLVDSGNNLYLKFQNNASLLSPVIGKNVVNCMGAFNNCSNIFGMPLMNSDICDSMYSTFRGGYNLIGNVEIGNNVKNIGYCFYNCNNLTGDLPSKNNITDMTCTFYECQNLNGNIGNYPNVTNMYQTFYNCSNLKGDPFCSDNVTSMYQAYYNCCSLTGEPRSGSKVTTMEQAYYNCTNINGTAMCGNNVTTIADAYWNCTSLDGAPVLNNAITNAQNAFYNCTNLRGTPKFQTKKLTQMYQTFYNCCNLSGTVDVPATVTDLRSTFYNCCNLSVIIIRGTNATTLAAAKQANCFAKNDNTKRLNVVYASRAVYNIGRTAAVAGCELTADTAFDEPVIIPQPYTYDNGRIYGYNNSLTAKRVSYNEEKNIYIYCMV